MGAQLIAILNKFSDMSSRCIPSGEPRIFSTEISLYLDAGAVDEMLPCNCMLSVH